MQPIFDFAVFSSVQREGCLGKVHLCAVCPESSGALKRVLGENLYIGMRNFNMYMHSEASI